MPNKLIYELEDLLYYLYPDSLIPELFESLGSKASLEFIEVFSDTTLKVPSHKRIMDLQRNIEIYENLTYVPGAATERALARKYGVTPDFIKKVYKRMRSEYPRIQRFLARGRTKTPVRITTKLPICKEKMEK